MEYEFSGSHFTTQINCNFRPVSPAYLFPFALHFDSAGPHRATELLKKKLMAKSNEELILAINIIAFNDHSGGFIETESGLLFVFLLTLELFAFATRDEL